LRSCCRRSRSSGDAGHTASRSAAFFRREALEARGERRDIGTSIFRLLLETRADEPRKRLERIAVEIEMASLEERRELAWRLGRNRRAELNDRVASKRSFTRHELEQRDAERPHVGPRIDRRARAKLLRRHVTRRAQDRAAAGHRAIGPAHLRNPEVEDLEERRAIRALRQKEIRRLDVAVDDAARVRDGERLARAENQIGRECNVERASSSEHAREILSFEVFIDDERVSGFGESTGVEDRDHVLAVERCGSLGLAQQSAHGLLVDTAIASNELQRDGFVEVDVMRGEDRAHSACADEALDSIAPRYDTTRTELALERPHLSRLAVRGLFRAFGPSSADLGRESCDDLTAFVAAIEMIEDLLPRLARKTALCKIEDLALRGTILLRHDHASRSHRVVEQTAESLADLWIDGISGRFEGEAREPTPTAESIRSAIDEAFEAARSRHPAIRVSDEDLLMYALARAEAPQPFSGERTSDLLLACGLARGDAAALRSFDAEIAPRILPSLEKLRIDRSRIDDVLQRLRVDLFVGEGDEPPRIAQYRGRGDLVGWLRVTAARIALRAEKRPRSDSLDEDLAARLPDTHENAELELLRTKYAGPFREAFREAIEALSTRERTLLRQHHADGLSIDALAPIHGVHRATVARWIVGAERNVLDRTRSRLRELLAASPNECESVMRALAGELSMSFRWLKP
jgi:RNA polymerase sigma-70 factor (ECF subfamily)